MTHCLTYIQALRERGYRITPQREIIIETLAHGDLHMSAEDVYQKVLHRSKAINLATVYRTLDLLVENGLASRFVASDGKLMYATERHGTHLHLNCRICGKNYQIDANLLQPLIKQIEEISGFKADSEHIALSGICKECLDKKNSLHYL
ncbi:MAG: Fur family transcriptional regulator [Anaerolineales bacterium]